MDNSTKGAWLVHHMHKLDRFRTLGEYSATRTAGKSGVLLSTISAEEQSTLSQDQLTALAKSAGIDPKFELRAVLDELKDHRLVEEGQAGIEILGLTNAVILSHTSSIFEGCEPAAKERAVIDLAELSSSNPVEDGHASQLLADTHHLDQHRLSEALGDAEEFGFVDFEKIDSGRKLYFKGYLFQRDAIDKIKRVLDSLSTSEAQLVREVDQLLCETACVAEENIRKILGEALYAKLHSIGMYDVNVVSNKADSVSYVTRPAAFSKYGDTTLWDAFDHAKALVAALKYGMERSSQIRGRITMVGALLRKLVKGEWVGPAPAIGQDYKLLEVRRVVETESTGGSYYKMRLLKPEVGQLALNILTEGDSSLSSLDNFPSASLTGYRSPERQREAVRERTRKQADNQMKEALMAIRKRSW